MKIPKNVVKIIVYLLITIIQSAKITADNRIVIHLRHAPEEVRKEIELTLHKEKGINKINGLAEKTPAEVSQKMVKKEIRKYLMPDLSGFTAVYSGYSDVSDPDGLISFPLRHTRKKVYVALTPEIKLIKAKENTVSHSEYIENETNPIEVYLFEQKQNGDKQPFWDVKKIDLPADKTINPITIVILTKPKNIFVMEGDHLSAENVQLVLPGLFVLDNKEKEKILLKQLDIKRYYEPIQMEEKKATDTVVQKMISNI